MSAWTDAAETLKARIDALALDDVEVVVDRQIDIRSVVGVKTAKSNGVLISITWDGCGIKGRSGKVFVTEPRFELRAFASGIVEVATGTMLDDVIEKILPKIHEWTPEAGALCNKEFMITSDVDLVPDAKLLIYGWSVECGAVTTPMPAP